MKSDSLSRYIDFSLLTPTATAQEIVNLCELSNRHNIFAVCVNPRFVPVAARAVCTNTKVCTVVGFPLGAGKMSTKIYEAEQALLSGANEIDMVVALGAIKEGAYGYVQSEVSSVAELVHHSDALLKVIIEPQLLTNSEVENVCEAVISSGADFVKTNTGYLGGGATVDMITMLSGIINGRIGIKASGGIRTRAQALSLISAGATRIGTSNAPTLLENTD